MSWKVVLIGNEVVLDYLSKTINDKDFSIIKEDDGFILRSEYFESHFNHRDVRDKVLEFLNSMNAVLSLFIEPYDLLNYKIFNDGREKKFARGVANLDEVYAETLFGLSEEYNIIRDFRKLSEYDENVRDIFQLVTHDFNSWVTWCKIIEILQKDDYKSIKKGGYYFDEVNRLNHTANAYKASGNDSRHHLDSIPPPENPMSFNEARKLIKDILIQWLDKKERSFH